MTTFELAFKIAQRIRERVAIGEVGCYQIATHEAYAYVHMVIRRKRHRIYTQVTLADVDRLDIDAWIEGLAAQIEAESRRIT